MSDQPPIQPVRVNYFGMKDLTLAQYLTLQSITLVAALATICIAHAIVSAQGGFLYEILEAAEESPRWMLQLLTYAPVIILAVLIYETIETAVFIEVFRKKAAMLDMALFRPPDAETKP